MYSTSRDFTSEFATELAELSQSFSEVAQTLQALQALLEEGNNQTKAILDILPIPILVLEYPSAHTFYINKKGQELVGTLDVLDLPLDHYQMYVTATGEICPIEKRPLRRTLQGEKVYEDKLEWHIGDRILPLEIWTSPIYDRQGNIVFAISIFQDSSQRKQAEKVLAESLIKQTELEAAKKIQAGLYPQYLPSLENFELASYCHPSFDVGGDLYDYHWNEVGELVITLADVMGKGMSAALLATSFRASLRLTSRQLSPGKAITATAKAMADDLDRSESYIRLVGL
ncbi:MAG: SpoIIE family protein phosphatase [Snowella sp.]|nr:SpoIIE family protein phosphatase [Snowella sp.]